jgi:hypothetical protein
MEEEKCINRLIEANHCIACCNVFEIIGIAQRYIFRVVFPAEADDAAA